MVTRNQRARAARLDHEREHDVIESVLSQSPRGERVVHAGQVAMHRVSCGWEDLSKEDGEPVDVPDTHNEFAQDRIEPS